LCRKVRRQLLRPIWARVEMPRYVKWSWPTLPVCVRVPCMCEPSSNVHDGIDRTARKPDSTQDGFCAVIQGRRGPHIQHDSMLKPLLKIESGAAHDGSMCGTGYPRCGMIGVGRVVCPRPRRLVEVIADLLSRVECT
jgi:hypothetical protein